MNLDILASVYSHSEANVIMKIEICSKYWVNFDPTNQA